MKKYCGNCEAFHEVIEKKEIREYKIKETNVFGEITILTCQHCNEEIYDKENEIKNDIILFDEYKRLNHLLTSIDIIAIRAKYSLSQAALSKLLGFGEKTITRYENGSIQDRTHDNLLRLIESDEIFLRVWLNNKHFLSSPENIKIMRSMQLTVVPTIKYDFKKSSTTYHTVVGRNEVYTYEGC